MNNNIKKTLLIVIVLVIVLIAILFFVVPFITDKLSSETKELEISKVKSEAKMILSGIESECAANELKYKLGTLSEDDIVCSQKKDLTNYVSKMVPLEDAKVKKVIYEDGKITQLIIITDGYTLTLVNEDFEIEK